MPKYLKLLMKNLLTLSLPQVTNLRQNFSLQYQYNIKQAGDENRGECQPWDY